MNNHLDKVKLSINETLESVANRFVEITKAYKSFVIDDFLAPSHANSDFSLTEEDVRKNRELYGHPDGRQEMSIEIGLPRWIVEGRNNIWVLSFYTLAFGGALPLLMVGQSLFSIRLVTGGCVFHSGPRSRQKTKDGVNGRIATVIFKTLQEDSSTNQVLGTLERSLR